MVNYIIAILTVVTLSLVASQETQQIKCGCKADEMSKRSNDFSNIGTKPEQPADKDVVVQVGDMHLRADDPLLQTNNRFRSAKVNHTWTNNVLKYVITGPFPDNTVQLIRRSLKYLSDSTGGCVRFEEYDPNYPPNTAYVEVIHGRGCSSAVGMNKRRLRQFLSLGPFCDHEYVVQHEFMHALGFHHEMSRPDRDQNIDIKWDNIESHNCYNFKRCNNCKQKLSEFDSKSVMLYDSWSTSCNTKSVMTYKNGTDVYKNNKMSHIDVQKLMALYKCRTQPNYSRLDRPTDAEPNCALWARHDFCGDNGVVTKTCPLECQYHNEELQIGKEANEGRGLTRQQLTEEERRCIYYKRQDYCWNEFREQMKQTCPGYCD